MRRELAVAVAVAAMVFVSGVQQAGWGAEAGAKKKTGARVGRKKAGGEAGQKAAGALPAMGAVDTVMGEYEGTFTPAKGEAVPAEAKVIAEFVRAGGEARKNYRAILSSKPKEPSQAVSLVTTSTLSEAVLPLTRQINGVEWAGNLASETLTLEGKGENGGKWELRRVVRHSPTEGEKPPAGAVVLLPYEPGKPTNLDAWRNKNWKLLPDGSMEAFRGNNLTDREFGSCKLHVEFLLPYQPEARDQGRGNSGVYMQDRYETQVLDSFGLPPKNNECGGIYEVSDPKVNACYPPLQWQTYDITFTAPKLSPDGTVLEFAKLTVVQNGVEIQKDVPVKGPTRAAGGKGVVAKGPLTVQDHGCPVRYRNIWLVEEK